MKITNIIKQKLTPTQTETLEDCNCQYYDIDQYNQIPSATTNGITCFHQNIQSLSKNCGKLIAFLSSINHEYDIIMLTEIGKNNIPSTLNVFRLIFSDYDSYYVTPPSNPKGGVAIFISARLKSKNLIIRNDLQLNMECGCSKCEVESLFIDFHLDEIYTIGCIYRHPNGDTLHFTDALRKSLDKIKHKGSLILSGDFNISLTTYTNNHVKRYIDDLAELNLIPVTTIPTRITESTATCIDHFYLRPSKKLHNKTLKTGVLFADTSDHLPIFLIIAKINFNSSERRSVRIHSETNVNKFIERVNNFDWTSVTTIMDTNEAYGKFIEQYYDIYNESFPLKKVSISRNKDKKWMTKGLRLSIQNKNLLYRKKIRNPTTSNIDNYKSYNKLLQKCLFHAENQYYIGILQSKYDSNNTFWKMFASIINPDKQKKKTFINKVVYNDNTYTDSKDISNAFNDHFVTVGKKLSDKVHGPSDYDKYMNINSIETIYLEPILQGEVIKEINFLKDNKSPGPDNIPAKIIKYSKETIAPCLRHIFNLSIQSGTYPDLLKMSKVIAIHKKKEKHNPDNYRPISLLDIINKIYEKLLYKRLINFLNKKKLLFEYQFGFRQYHSCSLALTEITDNIKHNIDKNGYTVGIFLDLCKAFDTVDHTILLGKLPYYGIRGQALSLIRSYLSNRHQYTVIN